MRSTIANDIYKAVTDRILELLEQGTVPWKKPIRSGEGAGKLPTNLVSLNAYRGINVFLLAVSAWVEGYESPFWLSYRQAAQKGGHVRKGEKGTLVVFWKQYATKDKKSGEDITVPVLRKYTVFNTDQCEGIEAPQVSERPVEDAESTFAPIKAAEDIARAYEGGPQIEHRGTKAFYRPSQDQIQIAEPDRFVDAQSYYATLFHELVHSTGHSSRLDRGLDTRLAPFGSPDYSKEELVAEMGAAFLAAAAGISESTIEQSASYIDGWRRSLSADPKLVVQAAGAAQKASDWILGHRPDPD